MLRKAIQVFDVVFEGGSASYYTYWLLAASFTKSQTIARFVQFQCSATIACFLLNSRIIFLCFSTAFV
jgi:hypothetical protein